MTLEKTLRQQLNSVEPGGFHFSADGWNVTLVTDKRDSLSCSLKELTLERATPIQEELKPWAERVAARVTGLIEPLSLIEADQLSGKAMLRSETPTVRDSKSFYYELILERTQRTYATLHRYRGDRQNGDPREAVSFVLTHDAIVKLVTDIVGTN
jgi:hypothetical protein